MADIFGAGVYAEAVKFLGSVRVVLNSAVCLFVCFGLFRLLVCFCSSRLIN